MTNQNQTLESSRFTSRKFLATIFTLASATALMYFGAIADGVYFAVVIATNTAYLAANVIQKTSTE